VSAVSRSDIARPRKVRARLLATAVLVVVLAGCTAGKVTPSSGDGQRYVTGDGTVEVIDPAKRKQAPDLAGTTLDGSPFSLADLRGQVVVLNVWASWCAPCRAEAPGLEKVSNELAGEGVRFVGINTRDTDDNARAFERRFGISYPSLIDRDGALLLRFKETLPPQAIPTTLVIDRGGRMAARALTPLTEERLRDLVTPIVAEDQR
jgi:thiol-disulfide isomerase/thioredoxin